MLRSRLGITANAPRNAIGIPRLTHTARRISRNSASTPKTSTKPAAPLFSRSASRPFRISDWSCQSVSVIPSGNQASAR